MAESTIDIGQAAPATTEVVRDQSPAGRHVADPGLARLLGMPDHRIPFEHSWPTQDGDPLAPSRGIAAGLLIVAPFWIVAAVLIRAVF